MTSKIVWPLTTTNNSGLHAKISFGRAKGHLDIAFPLLKQGDACSVPYEEHIEPLGQKKVTIFHGTLLNRTTNEAGQEGFLVKFNGYPEPEFVDGLSLMECRL